MDRLGIVPALGADQHRQPRERGEVVRILHLRAPARPMSGAGPPACEVLKKTGSTRSKSRSARMRSSSTDPTMPRQPMIPTFHHDSMNELPGGARRL